MPIKSLDNSYRLPRLGKIHLGIKVQTVTKDGKPVTYPQATDYFVVPPEVAQVYGEQPKLLDIQFPVDDREVVADQWYRCYSQSRGLICKSDGESATALVDSETGEIASGEAKKTVLREMDCDPSTCPKAVKGDCRPIMNLRFLLPHVPSERAGIYQLDTSSWNSMKNINTALFMLKNIYGSITGRELKLRLGPQEVQSEGKKRKVNVLELEVPWPERPKALPSPEAIGEEKPIIQERPPFPPQPATAEEKSAKTERPPQKAKASEGESQKRTVLYNQILEHLMLYGNMDRVKAIDTIHTYCQSSTLRSIPTSTLEKCLEHYSLKYRQS